MPQNRKQGIIFGLIMSYAMAYGMEVYNVAIKEGYSLQVGGFSTMTNHVFLDALLEALRRCAGNGFHMEKEYLDRLEAFFPMRDENNCERTYQILSKLGD